MSDDCPPSSKKQRRKQEKARWLAARKAAEAASGKGPPKRKCRNQRQSRISASVAVSPTIDYETCMSSTCNNRHTGSDCIIRSIEPYVHRFALFIKGRWAGSSLREVFATEFPTLSTDYCARAVQLGLIRVNGRQTSLDSVIQSGDFLEHLKHRHEPSVHLPVKNAKKTLDLTSLIHFETDEVIVVDKPSGIPVHPTGNFQFNALTHMLQHAQASGKLFPVHRLDRLTSGLLLLAKSAHKARCLSAELTATSSGNGAGKRSVRKYYVARVKGEFPDHEAGFADVRGLGSGLVKIAATNDGYWHVSAPIGLKSPRQGHMQCVSEAADSKPCVTLMRRRGHLAEGESIVECLLVTGRTHQIRVHLQHLGFPIVNDPLYGPVVKKNTPELTAMQVSSCTDTPTCAEDDEDTQQRCIRACDYCSTEREGSSRAKQDESILWLHSYRYESPNWSFQVPLPPWASLPKHK